MFIFLLIFGYVFSFLCLVDERSTVGFVFLFLLETSLCFCVCVLAGDWFVFLCLVDKKDLLPGLCLCYCWRPVCVFVFG